MTDNATASPRAVTLPASLKQVAMDEIRRRIFTRELKAGAKVDPEALGSELGMSKIPVREALSALVGEGIIELIPRRGAFVAPMSKRDIEDHYWMLAVVSGRAAERAAETLSESALTELEKLANLMERAATEPERDQAAFRFHSLINHAAQSPRMNTVLRMLGTPLPLGLYESHSRLAADADAEHREVLAALRSRKPAAARKAMERHFLEGARASIAALEAQGFWDEPAT
ncbi:GntR family transcriptional regulator [Nocardia violaceofusca]|uniref:GntR family transcriptional regulator n=1 Tax=Nocardia violaceofusca TaxID=941182 RepID=UPI0007A4BFC0|nr:GntR family transcriptional regulator [Nocardia violaceofusca]